ncbi:threonine/serine exporter family protein [uncultured Campylobacter sp.]|uniref:threonine/serine exporter family protein n=1 Tax=uncultured Campylobacter sp. TaxID=218934 RepID=UPI00261261D3|nr:threonine/serine exporter family protein [uncultured Campylobacter sp.]
MVFITHFGVFYSFTHTSDVAIGSSILFLMPGVFLINLVFDILNDNTLVGISRAVSTGILILCIAGRLYHALA